MFIYAQKPRRLSSLLVMVLVASMVLVACGRRHDVTNDQVRDRAENRLEDLMDDIDATDAQRSQLESILDGAMPTVYAMRNSKKVYGKSVVTELMQKKPDAKIVQNLVRDAGADATKHAHQLADSALAAHAVLSAEQRGQLGDRWDVIADDRRKPPVWMLDAIVKRGLDEIDATDAQYEYVLARKDVYLKRAESMKADREQTRAFFRAQVTASKVDRDGVHARIDEMSARMTDFAIDVAGDTAEFAGTLSDEQRQTIAEEFINR